MDIEITRGERGEAVSTVRRADGVTLRMRSYDRKHPIPHDLAHLALERCLGLRGAVWGSLCSGVVFDSVEVLDGRLPHDWRDRSRRFLDAHGDEIQSSEVLSGVLLEHVLGHQDDVPLERALPEAWGVLHEDAYPFGDSGTAAASDLRALGDRWAALGAGEALRERWPFAPLPIPRPERRRR
jgi:hypothetical protein